MADFRKPWERSEFRSSSDRPPRPGFKKPWEKRGGDDRPPRSGFKKPWEKRGDSPDGQAPSWPEKHLSAFADALADDLNSPLAFAAVFALVNEGNRLAQAGSLDAAGAAAALAALARMDTVLNVLARPAAAIPADVQALLDERAAARQAKNWAESDRLRDAIAALGWTVKDTKDGQRLSKS